MNKILQITGEEMIHLLERMGFYVKRKGYSSYRVDLPLSISSSGRCSPAWGYGKIQPMGRVK